MDAKKNYYIENLEKAIENWNRPHIDTVPLNVINALCKCVENSTQVELIVSQLAKIPKQKEVLSEPGDYFKSEVITVPTHVDFDDNEYCLVAITDEKLRKEIPEASYLWCDFKDLLSMPSLWDNCIGVLIYTENQKFMVHKEWCQSIVNGKNTTSMLFIKDSQSEIYADAFVKGKEYPEDEMERHNFGKSTDNEKIPFEIYSFFPEFYGVRDDILSLLEYYTAPLEAMQLTGFDTLLYSDFSAGKERFSIEERMDIALRAVGGWLRKNEESHLNIIFSCNEEEYKIVEEALVEGKKISNLF